MLLGWLGGALCWTLWGTHGVQCLVLSALTFSVQQSFTTPAFPYLQLFLSSKQNEFASDMKKTFSFKGTSPSSASSSVCQLLWGCPIIHSQFGGKEANISDFYPSLPHRASCCSHKEQLQMINYIWVVLFSVKHPDKVLEVIGSEWLFSTWCYGLYSSIIITKRWANENMFLRIF